MLVGAVSDKQRLNEMVYDGVCLPA